MNDSLEIKLKNEIDVISNRIDAIIKKIDDLAPEPKAEELQEEQPPQAEAKTIEEEKEIAEKPS